MKTKKLVYQRIADTIKKQIGEGIYRPGERIPPIRQLARSFCANKGTVQKALEKLKRENLIENKVGSGTYVRFPSRIQSAKSLLDFKNDYLSESFFPLDASKNIFNDLFESQRALALAGTQVQGDPDLIDMLSHRYRLPPERVLIISGAQQGLDLVAKVFSANISETMLFEDPTYPGAISIFRPRHFVPLEKDGPCLDCLDQRLNTAIRVFYTMPSVHNPTGNAYSAEKKQAVVQRAHDHRFYIIEDDYQGEYKPDGPRFIDIAPERTIYIKSFSQTMIEGIRLGFMVVPKDFHDTFVHAKYVSDIASSGLMQRFLHQFILQGHYDNHLKTVAAEMTVRRRRIQSILDRFSFLAVPQDQSGFSVWVTSEHPITSPHPPWQPGEAFSFNPEMRSFFRLSFMHLDTGSFEMSLPYLDRILSTSADA